MNETRTSTVTLLPLRLMASAAIMMTSVFASAQEVLPADAEHPQLTSVATLYVKTSTGQDPKDKTNYVPCEVWLVEDGNMTYYKTTGKNGIRGRGNSTWGATKKPWRLKFNDKVKFLGKDYANAKSWTLLANTYDKSLIRNALTHELGVFMNLEFSPAAKFVDLVMNGDYRGTYQISDQVEVRKKRVDISDDGWLLEYGNNSDKVDEPRIEFNNGNGYRYGWIEIKNPEFDNDDINANPDLAKAIREYMNDGFAKKMSLGNSGDRTNYDFMDPRTGYRSMVDADALINWYVATEITWNWDGLYSVYMFREPDGPLHFGPLWDEDLAWGNHGQQLSSDYIDGKLLAFSNWKYDWDYRYLQPLVAHFFDDPWFVNAAYMRYCELLDNGLEDYLVGKVDELKATIAPSAKKNFEKWHIWNVDGNGNQSWVNVHQGWNWEKYVDYLREFIPKRLKTVKEALEEQMNREGGKIQYFSENQTNKPVAGRDQCAVLDITAKAGEWTPLCVPCDISMGRIEYVFGKDAKVQAFTGAAVDADGTAVFKFTPVNEIKAGVPYMILPTSDVNVPYSLPWRVVSDEEASVVEHEGCEFTGVYAPVAPAGDVLMMAADGSLKPAEEGVKALHAYFNIPATAKAARIELDGWSGIGNIPVFDGTDKDAKVYDLKGASVGTAKDNLPHGVYIVKGRKVIK